MGDPVGLTSLPVELLQYLCLFLTLDDITTLSQTCVLIYNALNINAVWERFLTGDKKRVGETLAGLQQRLDPPFHPDPDFCENRQHLLRVNHLHTNWRDGRCSFYSKDHGYEDMWLPAYRFYYETYLLTVDEHNKVCLWEIIERPKKIAFCQLSRTALTGISEENVVEYKEGCHVKVYQVDLKNKGFPLRHTFSVHADEVGSHKLCNRCGKWHHMVKDRFLVSYMQDPHQQLFHIWDIVNATKIGAFQPNFKVPKEIYIHSIEGQNVVFWGLNTKNDSIFFKFNTLNKRFLASVFRGAFSNHDIVMYGNYVLAMTTEGDLVTYEVFDFSSSAKLKSKAFHSPNWDTFDKFHFIPKDVILGKLMIACSDGIHVVDALSLETQKVVPFILQGRIMKKISLAGESFVVTLIHNIKPGLWNVQNVMNCTTLPPHSTLPPGETMLEALNDIEDRESTTKLVFIRQDKLFVYNFW